MEPSDETAAWAVLSRAPRLTAGELQAALTVAGGAAQLLQLPEAALARAGLNARTCAFLKSPAARITALELRWLRMPRHRLIGCVDPDFPPLVRSVAACPVALFVAGDAGCLAEPQVAVVGSRNPTHQGLEVAFEFAYALSLQGLAVTSGLAEGIDAAAHRGALAAAGATLAILGTGADQIYPRHHIELTRQITDRGAIVSAFALGTPARRENFPQRNRLIAALSLGTLVVEAAPRSGSLLTARLAGAAGREVFAVPGSIHSPLSRGCHELIRRGAHLTENPDDILKALNFSSQLMAPQHARAAPSAASKLKPLMDKGHKILLDALGFEPADLDALAVRTGFKPETVSSMMLILELEGHVRSAHGGRYTRVARSP